MQPGPPRTTDPDPDGRGTRTPADLNARTTTASRGENQHGEWDHDDAGSGNENDGVDGDGAQRTRPRLRIRSQHGRCGMSSRRRREPPPGNSSGWWSTADEPADPMCYIGLARGRCAPPSNPRHLAALSPSSGKSRGWPASGTSGRMLVKFIARGTGSAGAAVDYLLGERDAAGQPRAGVELLRGDPEQVAAVANSLAFEHKYRSAVIAWSPDDRPTDAQIEAVLDEFEKTAWAGLRRPLLVDGGAAPRAGRRRSCARADRPLRPGDGQEPEHRAPRLAEDLRPAARRVQPRARLEPAGRPGAGEGAAARPSRLHRGGEPADRPGARSRPAGVNPGLPDTARRARRRAEPRRRRHRPRGSPP